ncbi:MAG: hypothetical protein ABEJ30_03595 [Halorientalis sp.]
MTKYYWGSELSDSMSRMRTQLSSALDTLERYERQFVEDFLAEYSTRIAFATYAFVFFYYGFLKVQALVTGLSTPVRGEVAHLVSVLGLPEFGVSLTAVMAFIGVYEMGLGTLFLRRNLRVALPLFLTHQAGTFITLVLARTYYFQDPFLLGAVPWLFDTFAAYILKNTIFVGGFLVLAAIELGDRHPRPATGRGQTATSRTSSSSD